MVCDAMSVFLTIYIIHWVAHGTEQRGGEEEGRNRERDGLCSFSSLRKAVFLELKVEEKSFSSAGPIAVNRIRR